MFTQPVQLNMYSTNKLNSIIKCYSFFFIIFLLFHDLQTRFIAKYVHPCKVFETHIQIQNLMPTGKMGILELCFKMNKVTLFYFAPLGNLPFIINVNEQLKYTQWDLQRLSNLPDMEQDRVSLAISKHTSIGVVLCQNISQKTGPPLLLSGDLTPLLPLQTTLFSSSSQEVCQKPF